MYKDRSIFWVIFAVLYLLVSNYAGVLAQNRAELFPVFNWSMFTNQSEYEVVNPTLFIDSLNGRKLPQPKLAYELKDEFPKIGSGVSLRKSTYSLVNAIKRKQLDSIERLRKVIERRYLSGPTQLSYSVRNIRFRPLDRLKDGSYEILNTIVAYERR